MYSKGNHNANSYFMMLYGWQILDLGEILLRQVLLGQIILICQIEKNVFSRLIRFPNISICTLVINSGQTTSSS